MDFDNLDSRPLKVVEVDFFGQEKSWNLKCQNSMNPDL